jgi:hypothetical protein
MTNEADLRIVSRPIQVPPTSAIPEPRRDTDGHRREGRLPSQQPRLLPCSDNIKIRAGVNAATNQSARRPEAP